jgi:hypothetical protein
MKLSKNLFLSEVIKSNTAIRLDIDNTPNAEHLENLKAIANNIFQPLRDYFDEPIGVSSGYRSPDLNKAIGGSKTSQHSKGEALDLDADIFGGIANSEIFEYIKDNLDFDQLISEYPNEAGEPKWVHVSYKKGNNRKQILKAVKENGKTKYYNYG